MLWKIGEVAPARVNPGAAGRDRTRGRVCHTDPIYFRERRTDANDGGRGTERGAAEAAASRLNPQDEPLLSKQTADGEQGQRIM